MFTRTRHRGHLPARSTCTTTSPTVLRRPLAADTYAGAKRRLDAAGERGRTHAGSFTRGIAVSRQARSSTRRKTDADVKAAPAGDHTSGQLRRPADRQPTNFRPELAEWRTSTSRAIKSCRRRAAGTTSMACCTGTAPIIPATCRKSATRPANATSRGGSTVRAAATSSTFGDKHMLRRCTTHRPYGKCQYFNIGRLRGQAWRFPPSSPACHAAAAAVYQSVDDNLDRWQPAAGERGDCRSIRASAANLHAVVRDRRTPAIWEATGWTGVRHLLRPRRHQVLPARLPRRLQVAAGSRSCDRAALLARYVGPFDRYDRLAGPAEEEDCAVDSDWPPTASEAST